MKRNAIKLNEARIRRIVSETIKNVLRESNLDEYMAGGNDWGDTYNGPNGYRSMNKTNGALDDVMNSMHTICQYYEEIYGSVYNGAKNHWNANPEYLQGVIDNIEPIYGLMANRTNRAGDAHAMTPQDIQELLPNFRYLTSCQLSPIDDAAKRAFAWCKNNIGKN